MSKPNLFLSKLVQAQIVGPGPKSGGRIQSFLTGHLGLGPSETDLSVFLKEIVPLQTVSESAHQEMEEG